MSDDRTMLAIGEIKITREMPDGRKRFREPENVPALAASLKEFGQLQPIIVEEDGELVAGMRRLTAAKSLGWTHVWVVRQSQISDLLARMIELEENLQRDDMTPIEKVRAVREIDRLRKLQDPNWGHAQTEQVTGVGRTHVSEYAKLAAMADLFPELADAKSIRQMQSWALHKAASMVRIQEVRSNPAVFQEVEEKIWLDDSVEAIKRIPEGSFDLILTDPPFGIGYDKRKAGEASASAYQDDEESYKRILSMAPDLYRVCKPNGWLVWFLGISWYERAKAAFREAGFTVDEIPLVWVRTRGRCYTARPDRYFARGYDIALHGLKGDPQMVIRNRPNVFDFVPIPSQNQEMLVERPMELYKEIIKHLTHEGERVADFFVGSGSVPAAAAALKRDYFGVEIDPERRAYAIKKIEANTPETT